MFYGREDIVNELSALWGKNAASLVTCRGRRRVGKSTLIEHFAKKTGARFIVIEGVKPQKGYSNADELKAFALQLSLQTQAERTPPEDWLSAFKRLDREIPDGDRTVVLLDEISWLGHYDPMFCDLLKIAWDTLWKKHDRLMVVLCGSVSSWIKEHIIENGEFVGRRSMDVFVDELPLRECIRFWGDRQDRLELRELLDVISVTGGIPKYLEELKPGLSAAENIRLMCFRPHSVLREDFDDMFADVITKQPKFTASVLRTLVDGPRSVTEIAEALGIEKGGRLSEALINLTEAGFVAQDADRNPETGTEIRERCYRLRDNYARFYLKYIEPVKGAIDGGAYDFNGLERLPGWEAQMGLQFENTVVNNYRDLLPKLHLAGALLLSAAPYRKTGRRGEGYQIDLLLQAKRFLYLIEVKRKGAIDTDIIGEMEEKIARLARPEGVSIRTALVYDGHLAPGVETEGFFDALVNARELLV